MTEEQHARSFTVVMGYRSFLRTVLIATSLVVLHNSIALAQAVTFRQSNYAVPQTPQTTVTVAYPNAQLAGDLNVVIVGWSTTSVRVQSVRDSSGNAYVAPRAATVRSGAEAIQLYYSANIVGAAANTVTVTFDATTSYPDIRIAEYSGIALVNPVDATAGASGSGTKSSSGALVTTNASDLLVAGNNVRSSTVGPGAGYTSRVITNPDGNILEDRVVTTAGSYSAAASLSGGGGWVMQLVAFRAAGGSGDTQPPTAPTTLTAVAVSSSQINLSWTAATDNVGVVGYRVERCAGAGCTTGFTQVGTPGGTSYSDTGLAAATSYTYRVRAADGAGNLGPYSATNSATTQTGGAPATVTFRQSNYAVPQTPQTTVTVAYPGAQLAGDLNVVIVGWNNATSHVVSVTDTAGNPYASAFGPTVQAGIQSLEIYYAANIVGAAANTVTVTFDAATSYPDIRIAEYSGIALVSPVDAGVGASGSGATSSSGTLVTMNANDLLVAGNNVQTGTTTPGAGYTSRVITNPDGNILEDRVVTAAGSYSASAALSGNGGWVMQLVAFRAASGSGDTQPPTAPTTLTAVAVSSSQINLSWTAATDNVGVVGYRVERCAGAGCTTGFTQVGTPGGTSYSDMGLLGATSYTYRVRAMDGSGNLGPYSDTSSATTLPQAPPTISIDAPPSGAVLTGTITLGATVMGTAIGGVQFQVDGVNVGPVVASPYVLAFDTAQFSNGGHVLAAYTWDNQRAFATALPVSVTFSNTAAGNPAQTGLWSGVFPWPLVSVHINLLRDGRVLAWDRMNSGNPVPQVWDPLTSSFTPAPTNDGSNLFCAASLTLPDGRLLSIGGHVSDDVGLPVGRIFNPATNLWSSTPNMSFGRWYPTITTLPDGRILALSGETTCAGCYAAVPEIYDPASNTWGTLPNASLSIPFYPHAYVLPDGRILVAATTEKAVPTRVLDLTTQTWSTVDGRSLDAYSSAMYLPGRILKSGTATDSIGSKASAATTYVLDMTSPSPSWRQVASMAFPRAYHVLTTLPDGNVLVTGGGRTTGDYDIPNAVYQAELWSPGTETWTTLSSMHAPRLYHGSAILLPDARVLVSGGGRSPGPSSLDQESAEIFAPPYLFKGPRPTITSAPGSLTYNQAFTINTPDAARIAKVAVIQIGGMTHGINMNQQYVPLSFTVGSGSLTVTAPANANLAPPGVYMLFIVDKVGVPSIASLVTF